MTDGELILVGGALLAAGIAASLVAGRLRVPGLLLFLGLGMLIGSDGTGWIPFDDYELARRIGIIALALILFEGGLTAGFQQIRPVLYPAASLAIVGTVATAAITAVIAKPLFDLTTEEAFLVGSILAATDGAAIFSLLRGSTLRRNVAKTLEAESGMNDPMAVLLVLATIEVIQDPSYGAADIAELFGLQLAVGAAVGLGIGWAAVQSFRRVELATPGLYPVASIAVAALAFGLADGLHGSGFLAVYLAGLMLGTTRVPAKRTMIAFHEGVAWVGQIAMFLVLGLLVFPTQLDSVALEGTVLAFFLAFLARPLATFLATAATRFTLRERVVLGWAGLRGAIPVVLATFPVIEGVEGSLQFFNIVFFAVLLSTLVQGTTFEPLARALGVTTREPALPRPLTETGTIRRMGAEVVEYLVDPNDTAVGYRIRDLGLPRDAVVNVIVRGEQAIPPRGSTRIEAGDELHILVRHEVADEIDDLVASWRSGPIRRARRPRLPSTNSPVFTVRPWRREDGDPGHPDGVLGVPVIEHMRSRRDMPGALVALADGRFAVSGPLVAAGGSRQLEAHARRRLARAEDEAERAWWQEVLGAVAMEGRAGPAGA